MAKFSDFRFGDLFRAILQGSLTEAIVSAEKFAERSLHGFLRYLVNWYKSLLIQYAAGAALALVAAVSLGSAITQGMIALGAAPWLANLLLCVAAGAGAFFLIHSAGARFRAEAEPREEKRGSTGTLDLLLQILLSRTAEPSPQSPPARKRKRRRKVVDVHPRDDDWEVSETGSRRKKRTYRTQSRAVKAAKAAARKSSAEVVIHGEDGRIRDVVAASHPTNGEDRPI